MLIVSVINLYSLLKLQATNSPFLLVQSRITDNSAQNFVDSKETKSSSYVITGSKEFRVKYKATYNECAKIESSSVIHIVHDSMC